MSASNAMSLLYLCLLAAIWATPGTAQEQAKWFVLRDQQTGYCRTALLPKVASYCPHGFAGIAGGPYDTEEQALDRQGVLGIQGACQQG